MTREERKEIKDKLNETARRLGQMAFNARDIDARKYVDMRTSVIEGIRLITVYEGTIRRLMRDKQ